MTRTEAAAARINRKQPALKDLTVKQRADLDRLCSAIKSNVDAFYAGAQTYEQFSACNGALHRLIDALDLGEAYSERWRSQNAA